MTPPLVLGVDGGGTKTVAWLAPQADGDGSAPILGRGTAGPGNPRAVGFAAAQANIASAVGAAFADARLPRASVAAACLGLAGAGRPDEQEEFAAWVRREQIGDQVVVCGDAELVLAAAAPDRVGVALISGTGSLAWGRNAAGLTARCGGWGYLLGDEGSGYAIALAGLRASVRAADGRAPPTALLAAMQQALGAADAAGLIQPIYQPEMTRERLATLCRVVFEAAEARDAAAEVIVAAAAGELAAMVAATVSRLGLAAGRYPLALAGGVLVAQPQLQHAVARALERVDQQPASSTIVDEPVRGAVVLARLAGGT